MNVPVNARFDGKEHVLLSLSAFATSKWNTPANEITDPGVSFRSHAPLWVEILKVILQNIHGFNGLIDTSYSYHPAIHDETFVRRKQRRNRTTFTLQQVTAIQFLPFYVCSSVLFSNIFSWKSSKRPLLKPTTLSKLCRIVQLWSIVKLIFPSSVFTREDLAMKINLTEARVQVGFYNT